MKGRSQKLIINCLAIPLLFLGFIFPIYGSDVFKNAAEIKANTNLAINKLRDEKYDGANDTACIDPGRAALERAHNQIEFWETYQQQNFEAIERQQAKLDDKYDDFKKLDAAVQNTGIGSQLDQAEIDKYLLNLDNAKKRREVAQVAHSKAKVISDQKYKEYLEVRQQHCSSGRGLCLGNNFRLVAEKEREYRAAQLTTQKAYNEYQAATRAIRAVQNAMAKSGSVKQALTDTRNDIVDHDNANAKAVAGAEKAGAEYQRYLDLIGEQTHIAEELAEKTAKRASELELLTKYSSDYELFDLLLGEEDNAFQNKSKGMFQSNLEVVAMAAAAVKDLRCGYGGVYGQAGLGDEDPYTAAFNPSQLKKPSVDPGSTRALNVRADGGELWTYKWIVKAGAKTVAKPYTKFLMKRWSDTDSKAYHLFRAASATYLIGQMNESADYADKVSCMVDEKFDEGDENYSDDKNEQVASIERATNLLDAIVENACGKVSPDDKLLDSSTFEKLNKVCEQKGITGVRTRESARDMYMAAYEAALQELAQKRERVGKAHGFVKKGEAWIKEDEDKIKADLQMFMTHTAIAAAMSAVCSTPTGSWACPIAAANAALAAYNYMQFLKHSKDLKKAAHYTQIWLNKKEQAMSHTHLTCNRPLAEELHAEHLQQAKDIKAKVKEEVDEARRLSKEGIEISFYHPSKEIKFAFDHKINSSISANMKRSRTQKEALFWATEWIRHMKGERQSLPYDYSISTNLTKKEVTKQLELFGYSIGKKVKNIALAISEMILPPTNANTDIESRRLDGTEQAMGISSGSYAFMYFIEAKGKHWLDQTFHPYNSKDPAGKMSEENIRKNFVNIDTLPAEFQVGMPIPETRVAYLGAILEMVNQNLAMLGDHLRLSVDQRDKMVHLLRGMKKKMGLKNKGVGEDTPVAKKVTPNRCLKKTANGDYALDPDCACRETNTCANFKYPKVGNIGSFKNDLHSRLALDGANDIISGKVGSGSIKAGELSSKSKATRQRIQDLEKDANQERQKLGLASKDFSDSANRVLEASRASIRKSVSDRSSLSVSFFDTDKNPLVYENSRRRRKKTKKIAASDEDSTSTNKKNKRVPISLKSKEIENIISKTGSVKKTKEELLDFDLTDEDQSGFIDMDLEVSNAESAKLKEGNQEGEESEYTDVSGHYLGRRNRKYRSNQITRDAKKSLFSIITRRYKKTAYPIFLKKPKATSFDL